MEENYTVVLKESKFEDKKLISVFHIWHFLSISFTAQGSEHMLLFLFSYLYKQKIVVWEIDEGCPAWTLEEKWVWISRMIKRKCNFPNISHTNYSYREQNAYCFRRAKMSRWKSSIETLMKGIQSVIWDESVFELWEQKQQMFLGFVGLEGLENGVLFAKRFRRACPDVWSTEQNNEHIL